MKKFIIVALVLVMGVLGYLFVEIRANRMDQQTTTFSDEGHTWQVGSVIMYGTNVPASQLRIAAIHSANAPPQTKAVLK